MSVAEITNIELLPLDQDRIAGFFVDLPGPAAVHCAHGFVCAGWVLGKAAPATGVELVGDDGSICCIPTGHPRPDVAKRYPDETGAAVSGWCSTVGLLGKDVNFEFRLQAVLKDDRKPVPLALIRGRRRVMSHGSNGIQPLMVTSLARAGSTWFMRLLAEHPGIVTERTYPYEVTPVRNWMQFLGALAQPLAEAQPFSFSSLDPPDPNWRVGPAFSDASLLLPPELHASFGGRFIEQAADFFRRSAEECYREMAARQDKLAPAFFAEKHQPYELPGIVWEFYPKAREILLVRDFRDMLCSITAFNRKRNRADFGRHLAATEEQYILDLGEKARRLLKAWKNRRDRVHLVRYEDLVSQTPETLAGVLDYLGLPADQAQVDGMIRRASVDTQAFQDHRTTSSAIESVGRWRRDLSPELRAICREAFGTTLAEFGYA